MERGSGNCFVPDPFTINSSCSFDWKDDYKQNKKPKRSGATVECEFCGASFRTHLTPWMASSRKRGEETETAPQSFSYTKARNMTRLL